MQTSLRRVHRLFRPLRTRYDVNRELIVEIEAFYLITLVIPFVELKAYYYYRNG